MTAQISPEAPSRMHVRTRVFHNSAEREVTFTVGETVEQCDNLAVTEFKIVTNPHTFGLYRADGITELLPLTARIARVEDHAPPLVRSGSVKAKG